MIHHGDCVEVMAQMAENSVDAIVTDPPYGLEFMGKNWDTFVPEARRLKEWDGRRRDDGGGKWSESVHDRGDGKPGGPGFSVAAHYSPNTRCAVCNKWQFDKDPCRCETPEWVYRTRQEAPTQRLAYQQWCEAWAREAFRVAKPGAYLLAFGGTRTVHRLASAIEDAGWEIRDELIWVYASGFPKSLNLKGEWEGWGTALKPAHEPIVMARKPLVGSVAANVTRYGTGALNIGATRIPSSGADAESRAATWQAWDKSLAAGTVGQEGQGSWTPADNRIGEGMGPMPDGRWPSNLLLSDPELFDVANPGVVGSGATSDGFNGFSKAQRFGLKGYGTDDAGEIPAQAGYGDSGGYSRFFIIPKADRADREPVLRGQLPDAATTALVPNSGNVLRRCQDCRRTHPNGYVGVCARCGGELVTEPAAMDGTGRSKHPTRSNQHPTVKPTDLMRHLVRLVTPPGGTVLDCFLGSGSTAIACEMEGFPWIGIEKEAEYVAIAEARLNGVQRGLGLDVPAPTRKPRKSAVPTSGAAYTRCPASR